jgi:hypothetical protein
MLRAKSCLAVILIAISCVPALAATDISGSWTSSFSTDVGEQHYTFTFKVTGSQLSGRAKSNIADVEILDGKVEGNTVTFLEKITFQGRDLDIEYTGTIVSDDEIKFTRKITGNVVEQLVAKRIK